MKNSNKNIFMSTLTALGMLIGIIISLILIFIVNKYTNWAALIVLACALIGRMIGYIFDKIVEKSEKK